MDTPGKKTALVRLTPAGVALLYVAVATLWIIASSYLLTSAVSDPLLQERIELAKGLLFVAVTGTLLYLLLKGWHEASRGAATAQPGDAAQTGLAQLVLAFVALALVVPLIGLSIVRIYIPQEEQETYRNLEAVAKLKEDEIKNWLDERRGDSEVLAGDDAFVARVVRFLRQRQDAELPKLILDRFDKLRSNYGYTKILLFDAGGRLLLSSGEDVTTAPVLPSMLRQAIASKQIQRRDIYRDEEGHIHLEWAAPLVVSGTQDKRAVAVVVLRITAQRFIYPLIQNWPSASASAETLLVRRDGESVLFLNKLRHSGAEPMSLRMPLSATKLPDAAAILANRPGTAHGMDYRGADVLAAYRPVAGTNWHIVAKIDRAEVLKPMWELVHMVTLTAFAAIGAIMAALLMLWRHYLRAQRIAAAARATEESERRFRAITQSANDAIVTADGNGNVTGWNPAAERMFGHAGAEMLGQPLTLLMPERFHAAHCALLARRAAGENPHVTGIVELAGLRRDGSEFPLELSLAQWQTAAGKFFTAIIRDISERKRSEEELRASEARYASLFGAIADAVYVHAVAADGMPGQFLQANDVACSQTGYTRAELLGMTPAQLDAPDSGIDLAQVTARLRAGESVTFEQVHLTKDGRRIPVEIHAHLFMLNGRQTVISIARDITKRKQAEAELKKRNVFVETMLENAPIGFAVNTIDDGRLTFVSRRFAEIYGMPPGRLEAVGDFFDKVYRDPVFRENIRARVMADIASGKVTRMHWEEVPLLSPDGSYRYISAANIPLPDQGLMISTVWDVTDRYRAESALRESEEIFSRFMEFSPIHVFFKDENIRSLRLSKNYEKMLGKPVAELLGKTMDEIFPSEFAKNMVADDLKIMEEGKEITIEEEFGGRFYSTIKFPIFIDGKPRFLAGYTMDITERKRLAEQQAAEYRHIAEINAQLTEANQQLKQAQNQLLQSEKMAAIGHLAAGVAHEINNPIGYVNSNLGTLEKYLADIFAVLNKYETAETLLDQDNPQLEELRQLKKKIDVGYIREDTKALLKESRQGLERVKRIVLDLKNFSRSDAEEQWAQADLNQGMEATLNVIWNELKYKCEVVKEYGQLPGIYCLPAQLDQVFLNLLVNASQAIETRGKITIRTGQEGDRVWVEVSDTGKGIPPENIPHLFEPFFTTKPVGQGTGLGLSLSYTIVAKHHGEIEVHSEVGKGSVFRVWLPVQQPVSEGTA